MRAVVLQGRKLFFNFACSERCSPAVLDALDRGYALLIGLLVCLVTFNTKITHLRDALCSKACLAWCRWN
jgi:hypothetical protein